MISDHHSNTTTYMHIRSHADIGNSVGDLTGKATAATGTTERQRVNFSREQRAEIPSELPQKPL